LTSIRPQAPPPRHRGRLKPRRPAVARHRRAANATPQAQGLTRQPSLLAALPTAFARRAHGHAGPSDERAVRDAAHRVRDGSGRQRSARMIVHQRSARRRLLLPHCRTTSTKNSTLLRPDLIDHARPAHFLTTPITTDRTRPPSSSLLDLVLLAHPQFGADFSRFAAAPPPANLHHAWAALPGFSCRSRKGGPARSGGPPFLESPGVTPNLGRRRGGGMFAS
jgi:hypothetical protein